MVRHRKATRVPAEPAGTDAVDTRSVPRGARGIRTRMTWIVALPMAAVVALLAVVATGDVGAYRAAQTTIHSVALALDTQDLVQQLQQERGLTSGLLGGDASFQAELAPTREQVVVERGELATEATGTDAASAAVRAALAKMDGLEALRAKVDAGKVSRADAFAAFNGWIAALNGADLGLDNNSDRTLRRGIAALSAVSASKEYLSQERAFLNGVFAAGAFHTGEYAQFVQLNVALRAAGAQLNTVATPRQLAQAAEVEQTGAIAEAVEFEARAMAAPDGRPLLVDPQQWWSAYSTVLDDAVELEQSIGADIQRRAGQLRTAVTQRLALLGGLVLLSALGSVALLVAAARSVTRPLAALATEADAVTSQRLPDAVARVQTGDEDEQPEPPPPVRIPKRATAEIYAVANALDRLQGTAYALATEQALLRRNTTESLANLGRRNQNLLRRQLGFITRLESEESDPTGLANLFELDHLATRMRRNAESLLVLVGEGTPRRWSVPMPIADVIRAAISEVEEYRRVSLRRLDDAYVGGGYVTGLAHMIAELVENGLAFSPPDVDVEIQSRVVGNQYLIAIIDQGVGMTPEDLARANARLRGEEHFLMAPARFLGHYVVGQLARQLQVDVELVNSPVTGITARVTLPPAALATPAAIEPTVVVPTAPVHHGSVPLPPAPAPVAAQLSMGIRPAPVVEYITVADPAPVAATALASAPDDVERTRNGLRKRLPRTRPAPAASTARSAPEERPAPVDGSPEQLRDRLVSLRAGVHRGQTERSGQQHQQRENEGHER